MLPNPLLVGVLACAPNWNGVDAVLAAGVAGVEGAPNVNVPGAACVVVLACPKPPPLAPNGVDVAGAEANGFDLGASVGVAGAAFDAKGLAGADVFAGAPKVKGADAGVAAGEAGAAGAAPKANGLAAGTADVDEAGGEPNEKPLLAGAVATSAGLAVDAPPKVKGAAGVVLAAAGAGLEVPNENGLGASAGLAVEVVEPEAAGVANEKPPVFGVSAAGAAGVEEGAAPKLKAG